MKKYTLLLIGALFTLAGCIKNDIPYPIRRAVIKAIEFNGQQSVEIDLTNRIVNVVISDTTDITKVQLIKFETTENTTVVPSITELPMMLNLENDFVFSLHTYQQYDWTIKASRFITRSADFEGQVRADFNQDESTAIIYVDNKTYINRANMKVNSLVLGPPSSTMSVDPTTITDWTKSHDIEVTAYGETTTWNVTVKEAFLTESPVKIRAYYTVLKGLVMPSSSSKYGFEYKRESDATYKQISGSAIQLKDGLMTVRIDTDPATKYLYRIFLDDRMGNEETFTTDVKPTSIPNFSFNDWMQDSKVYYPCTEEEYKLSPYGGFWNSGNDGVSVAGKESNVYPTDDAVEGKAACLETIGGVLFVKMAAGSLFTGDFKTNITNPLTSPKFGRPYVGRPDKLVGKYKYFPKTIDIANTKDTQIKSYLGQMDRCIIWVSLEDWGGATTRPEKEADRNVIAKGEFRAYNTVDKYSDFEVILDYKTENRMPTHIVIVSSASEFGDYYTGGIGTKLFLDEFQLIYK